MSKNKLTIEAIKGNAVLGAVKSFDEMPEKLKNELFKRHTHAEIASGMNPDQIVYLEKDVIELMKMVEMGNFS